MPLTDHEAFDFASRIMGEGISKRAWGQIDPTLHILAETDQLWCTGGPGHRANTVTRRYCRQCLSLARQMYDDLSDDEGEED